MGSMRPGGNGGGSSSRFLPFSKNIQRTQKQPVPPAFPQSLSGSETDVSTSNENLSNEERYVMLHTARVEPQGQETRADTARINSLKEKVGGSNRSSLKEGVSVSGAGSNRSSLDVSSSSYNTLIIHAAGDDAWTSRLSGIRDHSSDLSHAASQSPYHTLKREPSADKKKPSGIPLPVSAATHAPYIDIGGQRIYTGPPDRGVQEITEIPDDFLNQSSVLKHLAKEVAQSPTPRAPSPVSPVAPASPAAPPATPPALPPTARPPALAKDKLSLSRSQPDLSSVERWSGGGCGGEGEEDEGFAAALDELAAENQTLKQQLSDACTKIAKSDQLRQEVEKVRWAHEELVRSCERRERLERAARVRLQADCRRLQDVARALRAQLDARGVSPGLAPGPDALRSELANRDLLVAQLVAQNKELALNRERQEVEMAAQRATLQEQRTHIDILDAALTDAQADAARLEHEVSGYAERVAGLQLALASLQQASERREHSERKLRAQLEKELGVLRKRECGACGQGGGGGACGQGGGGAGEAELRRALREGEERALALEGECAKWEQRCLEEAALRQAVVSAANLPNAVLRDARIAALEKTWAESERLMAEARSEKIRHMDELHVAQKKCADLDSRVKELESKVCERDAMISVLQKHAHGGAYDSSASLRNNSSREQLVGFGASSSNASFSSAEGGVGARYRHLRNYGGASRSDNTNSNSGYESTSLRLNEELAALDARLDSRHHQPAGTRALCCLPGLGARGKPPSGFLALSRGPEEALLLEKQGRSSQQSRAASLPPAPPPLHRAPRKPQHRPHYDRLDRRKDSDGSGSLGSCGLRGSPLPYERASRSPRPPAPPRTPLHAGVPQSPSPSPSPGPGSRSSSGSAGGGGSLPSPSKLALYAAARRRSSSLNKELAHNKCRIQL